MVSSNDEPLSPLLSPPPRNFTSARNLEWAIFFPGEPPYLRRHARPTGRRLAGVKYEQTVQHMLCSKFPQTYLPSPWLKFKGANGVKWCQPDGLLFDLAEGIITIIEVKYQHTSDAWWQLRKLYEPVLRRSFNHSENLWDFRVLEIVKWYDPLTIYPEPVRLLEKIEFASKIGANITGLHIWTK
jgi:hypothetical protein